MELRSSGTRVRRILFVLVVAGLLAGAPVGGCEGGGGSTAEDAEAPDMSKPSAPADSGSPARTDTGSAMQADAEGDGSSDYNDCHYHCYQNAYCEGGQLKVWHGLTVDCWYYDSRQREGGDACLGTSIDCGGGCEGGMCGDDRAIFQAALDELGTTRGGVLRAGRGGNGLPDTELRDAEGVFRLLVEYDRDLPSVLWSRLPDERTMYRVLQVAGDMVEVLVEGESIPLKEARIGHAAVIEAEVNLAVCAGNLEGTTADGRRVRVAWMPAPDERRAHRCFWEEIDVVYNVVVDEAPE